MGHIYFVRENSTGSIKISWSSNIHKRASMMDSRLALLGAYVAAKGDEDKVKEKFKEHCIHADWFRPGKELLAFIDKCKMVQVPLNLSEAAKEYENKPSTDAGKECRKLLELSEYHMENAPVKAEGRLVTVEEAAGLLGISSQTLRNWEKKGTLVPERTEGGHRRYKESEVLSIKKKKMSGFEFIVSLPAGELWEKIHNMLSPFDPLGMVHVSMRHDQVDNVVRVTVDSEDMLTTVTKTFNIKD